MKAKLVFLLMIGAVAILPTRASAGEFEAHCEGATLCKGIIQGTGAFHMRETSFLALEVTCTSVEGETTLTTTSSTGSARLTFQGCSLSTGVKCGTPPWTGTITTNPLTTDFIRIDPISAEKATGTPGVLFTGLNVTITCGEGGFVRTITGSVIGHIENPECGVSRTHHTISFEESSAGQQRFKQVTTAGAIYNLNWGSPGGLALPTSWMGTWHTTYAPGTPVKLTC